MRTGIIALMLLILCSSIFAIDPDKAKRLGVVADSLRSLRDNMVPYFESLDASSQNGKSKEHNSAKSEGVTHIKILLLDCFVSTTHSAIYVDAYVEGAPLSSCKGLKTTINALDVSLEGWYALRQIWHEFLGSHLRQQSDSVYAIAKHALLYIRDNVPDNCVLGD